MTEETTHDLPLGFTPPPTHAKAAFTLLRVSALLSEELDDELQKDAGVGLSEMLVLLQLMFVGGKAKMAELADSLVVTRGGVTKLVDRLVAAGYLDRVPSEEDRRVVYAQVTDAARELVVRAQPSVEACTERRLSTLLDEEQVETVHDLMHRLSCDNPGWEPPQVVTRMHDHSVG